MSQRSLFDESLPEWEQDAAREVSELRLATVIFPEAPGGPFDYLVPESLCDSLRPGMRVRVPLGGRRQLTTGYCVAVAMKPTPMWKLREIAAIIDPQPLLSGAMLRVTEWMAEHWLCTWGQVFEAIVPAGVRHHAGTREIVKLHLADPTPEEIESLGTAPDAKKPESEPGSKPKLRPLTATQRKVIDTLRSHSEPMTMTELTKAAECGDGIIRTLIGRRWIERCRERVDSATMQFSKTPPQPPHRLHADQQQALDAILESLRDVPNGTNITPDTNEPAIPMPTPVLIHGVTGSGKTEVYIRAIEEVVRRGKQAIVLVPEISLTPQTVARFRGRFAQVAILHSHLSDVERHREWKRIVSGAVQVVVGARSAVFAPVPNPGMIILDEEHESTFKQETSPRYHARDVAIRRAQEEGLVLVLGSATPSLESWYLARQRKFRLVSMPRRVAGRPMPLVQTIDLRMAIPMDGPRSVISLPLYNAIRRTLDDDAHNQVILLLNRRGYSTQIQCPQCGEAVKCPHCDIAMTYHRKLEAAICHYCDHETLAPKRCPKCGYEGIRHTGFGTERLETEIFRRFPDIETIRMDTDTMRRPGAHEAALELFRSGAKRVLLGTQMIAKGFDFPNVTLVGVINADTALHLPDFRASERTFCLVTQVAGRTGRGERGGQVLIQTYSPEHDAISAAIRHDYHRFAETELPQRKMFGYPPFARMIRIVVRGPVAETTQTFAGHLAEQIREELVTAATFDGTSAEPAGGPDRYGERVLGPAEAPFPKLRGYYRFQIQLTGHHGRRLRDAVRSVRSGLETPPDIQWVADVDPFDML